MSSTVSVNEKMNHFIFHSLNGPWSQSVGVFSTVTAHKEGPYVIL